MYGKFSTFYFQQAPDVAKEEVVNLCPTLSIVSVSGGGRVV